jgi:hypothetical protein
MLQSHNTICYIKITEKCHFIGNTIRRIQQAKLKRLVRRKNRKFHAEIIHTKINLLTIRRTAYMFAAGRDCRLCAFLLCLFLHHLTRLFQLRWTYETNHMTKWSVLASLNLINNALSTAWSQLCLCTAKSGVVRSAVLSSALKELYIERIEDRK